MGFRRQLRPAYVYHHDNKSGSASTVWRNLTRGGGVALSDKKDLAPQRNEKCGITSSTFLAENSNTDATVRSKTHTIQNSLKSKSAGEMSKQGGDDSEITIHFRLVRLTDGINTTDEWINKLSMWVTSEAQKLSDDTVNNLLLCLKQEIGTGLQVSRRFCEQI